jgi:hypothetical protein
VSVSFALGSVPLNSIFQRLLLGAATSNKMTPYLTFGNYQDFIAEYSALKDTFHFSEGMPLIAAH